MNIKTEFELRDKVKIKVFDNIEGMVDGYYYSYDGLKYYISFYKDCRREYEYLYANELEKI